MRTAHSLTPGKLYVATVQGTISYYGALNYLHPQAPFDRVCGLPEAAPMFPSAAGSGRVSDDAQFIFSYLSARPCTIALPEQRGNFKVNTGPG